MHFVSTVAVAAAALAVASAETHTVKVGPGNTFSPNSLRISVGDTINWESQGGHHDVAQSKSQDEPCVAFEGGWKSSLFSDSAKTYSQTFSKAGNFAAYCTIGNHCADGMSMKIFVADVAGGDNDNTAKPSSPAGTKPSTSPSSTPSKSTSGAASVSAFGTVAAVAVAGAVAAQLF